jgi:hypothetical protein
MIWLQMAPIVCVWLAWIFWRRTRWADKRKKFGKIPRGHRIALSLGAAILGPAMLMVGLILLDMAFGIEGQLSLPSLASILVLGIGFIEVQMAAVALTGSLVSENVTAKRRPSSKMEEPEEDQS